MEVQPMGVWYLQRSSENCPSFPLICNTMRKAFLIPILWLSLLTACKPDKIDTAETDEKAGPQITPGDYPMQTGHIWVYDNGDTIKAMGDTTINGISTRKMVKKNGTNSATAYYANLSGGWCLVASTSTAMFNIFTDPSETTDTAHTLHIPDQPAAMNKQPVTTLDWQVNIPGVTSYTRRWVGYYTIKTPAGTFDCVKLSTGTAFEYYSTKGIVRTDRVVTCVTSPCPTLKAQLIYVNF